MENSFRQQVVAQKGEPTLATLVAAPHAQAALNGQQHHQRLRQHDGGRRQEEGLTITSRHRLRRSSNPPASHRPAIAHTMVRSKAALDDSKGCWAERLTARGMSRAIREPANLHQSMEQLRNRIVPLGRTCFEECHGARSCRKDGRDQRLRSLYCPTGHAVKRLLGSDYRVAGGAISGQLTTPALPGVANRSAN